MVTVWKFSFDCSDVLSFVLDTFSNCALPDKGILVENVIVNKTRYRKSNYALIFFLQLLEM